MQESPREAVSRLLCGCQGVRGRCYMVSCPRRYKPQNIAGPIKNIHEPISKIFGGAVVEKIASQMI